MDDNHLVQRFDTRREHMLEALYDCAYTPGRLQRFLADLVDATDSRSSRLLLMNKDADEVRFSTKFNIDDQDHQRYVDHYVNTCPWRLELKQKPSGRLYSTYHDFTCRQPSFYKTEFFNDWAKGLDIHHGICGTVYETDQHKVQLLVQRTQGQGAYSRQATQLVNSILPHVRQVLRFSQQDHLRSASLWSVAAAAELRPLPFILLDKAGRVVYMSDRCEALKQDGDLDVSKEGILCFPISAVQQRFLKAVTDVNFVGQEVPFAIRRRGRSSLRCLLTPVHPSVSLPGLWPVESYIALYIHDPEDVPVVDPQVLIDMYSLTESEARIAIDIARGQDPRFIAERDNRSAHTVRSQLKSIFKKTRCNRQNQLSALILQSPAVRRR